MNAFNRRFSQFFDLVPEEELGEAQDYLRLLTIRWMRAVALLMTAGVLAAWPTDYLLFSDSAYVDFLFIWRTTLGSTTLLLSVGLTYLPWMRKHPVTVFNVSAIIVMGVSGAAVGRLGGMHNPFLYSVYSIPATTVALLTTLPRRIFATLVIAAAYLAGFFSTVAPGDVPLDLGGPLIFLVASCIGMIFIGHVVYRLVGSNHVRRLQLERILGAREKDLALATREALTAHEQVRKQVLRDLHDSVGPIITALHLETYAARKKLDSPAPQSPAGRYLNVVEDHAQSLKDLIRRTLRDLDPYGIERGPLTDVITSTLTELGLDTTHTLTCSLDAALNELPAEVKQTLHLIIRECANNTAKYAKAGQIELSAGVSDGVVRLTFVDDGVGCDPERTGHDQAGRYGLAGIRLRAIQAGGRAEITSAPGAGFRVDVSIPLRPDAGGAAV